MADTLAVHVAALIEDLKSIIAIERMNFKLSLINICIL